MATGDILNDPSVDVGHTGGATTVEADWATTPTEGSLLIALCGTGADPTGAIVEEAGWNGDYEWDDSDLALMGAWKYAGASEATTVTFDFSGSEEGFLILYEIETEIDTDPTDIWDADTTAGSATSLGLTLSSATTDDVQLILAFSAGWEGNESLSWTAGYTEDVDSFNGSFMNYGSASRVISTSETPSCTATYTASQNNIAFGLHTFLIAAGGVSVASVAETETAAPVGVKSLMAPTTDQLLTHFASMIGD